MRNSVCGSQIIRAGLLCVGIWSLLGVLFGLARFEQDMNMTTWWRLLFAGVSPKGRVDPYPLISWYAWMFPGIMGALLYSHRQHSNWRYFVLTRVGYSGRWLRRILYNGFIWSVSYTWIGLGVYTSLGLLFGVSASGLLPEHVHMCVLSSIHISAVCIWIMIIGMWLGYTMAIGTFIVVDGITAIVSGMVYDHSPWLVGSIGMWSQNSTMLLDWCLPLLCLVSAFLLAPVLARNILEKGKNNYE